MPILPSTLLASDKAALQQWLVLSITPAKFDAHWRGLAYQTLQTQGASQSISVDRGYLDNFSF